MLFRSVPQPPAFLKPEMTVSVEMVVGRRDSALVLPADAVRDADAAAAASGKAAVLAVRDGRAERVPVSVGLRGVGTVEVLEGLAEGDAVILPSSSARPGDRVRQRAVRALANPQAVPMMTR